VILGNLPRLETPESNSPSAEIANYLVSNYLPDDRELLVVRHSLRRSGNKRRDPSVQLELKEIPRPNSDSVFVLPVGSLLSDLAQKIKKLRPEWQEWGSEES
jgi:hypothetical protein